MTHSGVAFRLERKPLQVHIDVGELRLAEGRLFMFLAIDRVARFVDVGLFDANTKMNGAAGLRPKMG